MGFMQVPVPRLVTCKMWENENVTRFWGMEILNFEWLVTLSVCWNIFIFQINEILIGISQTYNWVAGIG